MFMPELYFMDRLRLVLTLPKLLLVQILSGRVLNRLTESTLGRFHSYCKTRSTPLSLTNVQTFTNKRTTILFVFTGLQSSSATQI